MTPVALQTPTPQVVGWSAAPLSIVPSQSSSMALQVSAVGVPGVQVSGCGTPPTQAITPVSLQAPTPQVVGWSAAPLSIAPSQSSSMALQISAVGVPGVQVCGTPKMQSSVVTSQAPTPQVVWPRPSSTKRLQSSSMLLQISGWGCRECRSAGHRRCSSGL